MNAPLPQQHAQRLAALLDFAVLDAAPKSSLDDLAQLASRICQTPITLLFLIEGERQWFKSRVGLAAQRKPRDLAFCVHAILVPDHLFQVLKAREDPLFARSALVTGTRHALGTLCVIDRLPRALTPAQNSPPQALGRHVVALLALRHALAQHESDETLNRPLTRALVQGTLQILMADAGGNIKYVSPNFTEQKNGELFWEQASDLSGLDTAARTTNDQLGVNCYVVIPVEFGSIAEVAKRTRVYWTLTHEPPFAKPKGR